MAFETGNNPHPPETEVEVGSPKQLLDLIRQHMDELGYENPAGRSCILSIATRVVNSGEKSAGEIYEYLVYNGIDAFITAFSVKDEVPISLHNPSPLPPAKKPSGLLATPDEPPTGSRRRITQTGLSAATAPEPGELLESLKNMRDNVADALSQGKQGTAIGVIEIEHIAKIRDNGQR